MTGPAPAVAATRVAVRRDLATITSESGPDPLVLVACSGGADSLALAAAAAFEAPRAGVRAGAVVVDHGLQPGSEQVAADAARACAELGLAPVEVVRVRVSGAEVGNVTRSAREGPGPRGERECAEGEVAEGSSAEPEASPETGTRDHPGPEGAARAARYEAFEQVAHRLDASAILLAHTRNDQAEQVLLGLLRGSGARSLAGMPARRGLFHRPFLDLAAEVTKEACAEAGLSPWQDPHNADRRYSRVRARSLLAAVEREMGPGVISGLARSAALLRVDADALDALASDAATRLGAPPWSVRELSALAPAVRTRTWRLLARHAGVPPRAVMSVHVDRLDALLTHWRGQGGVHLPGGAVIGRAGDQVSIRERVGTPRGDGGSDGTQ